MKNQKTQSPYQKARDADFQAPLDAKGLDGRGVDRALTEYEAALIMGKAVQSCRNERHRRVGCTYVKLGKSVRYLLSDIEEYLQKHRIVPGESSHGV